MAVSWMSLGESTWCWSFQSLLTIFTLSPILVEWLPGWMIYVTQKCQFSF